MKNFCKLLCNCLRKREKREGGGREEEREEGGRKLVTCTCRKTQICFHNFEHTVNKRKSTYAVALFPGSPHVLQETESWAGPGNEATYAENFAKIKWAACCHMHDSIRMMSLPAVVVLSETAQHTTHY